jgi:hypothetical protein
MCKVRARRAVVKLPLATRAPRRRAAFDRLPGFGVRVFCNASEPPEMHVARLRKTPAFEFCPLALRASSKAKHERYGLPSLRS